MILDQGSKPLSVYKIYIFTAVIKRAKKRIAWKFKSVLNAELHTSHHTSSYRLS